jgi:DNA-binding response OmpR family regulator
MKAILVVEDELSIRSFICLNLRRKKYKVLEAETGEKAIEMFASSPVFIKERINQLEKGSVYPSPRR